MTSDSCLDHFDLLGVGGREDSYSDLLGHAFRCSEPFRDLFLRQLLGLPAGEEIGDWQAVVRPGINPVDLACCDGPPVGGARRPDVPDLVFYHRQRSIIVAVANQLFVTEEPDRTDQYAGISHRAGMAELLGIENPSYHMYYLSLRGARPASPAFKAISYRDLLDMVLLRLPIQEQEPIGALLGSLRDRLAEYYGRRPPAASELLNTHLRYQHRLVFSYRNFEVFAADLFPGYLADGDVTSNMECCYIPLYRAWKPSWLAYPNLTTDAARCYSAHYELQWNTKQNRLNLHFHVETDAWRAGSAPQCLVRDTGGREFAQFQDWRAHLYGQLGCHQKALEAVGWQMRRSFATLMTAQMSVTNSVTSGEVRDRIAGMLAVATPLVDTIVDEAATQLRVR